MLACLTFVFLFNQVADDFVIKVCNRFPLNAFSEIFLLFRPKCQFNEKLLQFLITVIDVQLFKTILLKYLKAVNVQDTYHHFFTISFRLSNQCISFIIIFSNSIKRIDINSIPEAIYSTS